MPSPTRKSKNGKNNSNNSRKKNNSNSRNNSRNNSRKKYTPRGIMDEPLFQAMNRGNISWGNLMTNENSHKSHGSHKSHESNKSHESHKSHKADSPIRKNNALENWSMPDLTMRKGIWEQFPVTLVALDDRDGTERYAIEWHKGHLKEWKEERSASFDEWMEYKAFAEFRLLHALHAHPHKYVVEAPRNKNQIVVIAMAHAAGPRPDATATVTTAVATVAGPVLRKLNDIKEHFPVVWHPVTGRPGKATYALELFGKKVRDISMAIGHNITGEVTAQLLSALRASNAWHVLPTEGKELCRLEMA